MPDTCSSSAYPRLLTSLNKSILNAASCFLLRKALCRFLAPACFLARFMRSGTVLALNSLIFASVLMDTCSSCVANSNCYCVWKIVATLQAPAKGREQSLARTDV